MARTNGVGSPFLAGALSAVLVASGFAVAGLTDVDGVGWDVGLVLVCAGTALLFLGGFFLQVRAGLRAMRADVRPLGPVATVTVAICLGATAMFALALALLLVVGNTDGGPDWVDLIAGAGLFVPWVYGLISAAVITAVVAATQHLRRRRASA